MLARSLGPHAMWCTQIPGVPVCRWNSPNIPAGTSQLHCLFSSAVRQLDFETKSPKLSKMWLPPLNFTQADQRQLLKGGTCPDFSLDFSCVRKRGHPLLHESFIHRSYLYAQLPMQPWTSTNITHPLTSSRGYFRPSTAPWYNTRRDPEQKLRWYQLSDAAHALAFYISAPQLFNVDRNKKIRGDITICQRSLLVCVTFLLFPNVWKLLLLLPLRYQLNVMMY